jgi:hypothetical protein
VYVAACGKGDFKLRATPNVGYLLPRGDSPLLFWEREGYSLEEPKGRPERLTDRHMQAIPPCQFLLMYGLFIEFTEIS